MQQLRYYVLITGLACEREIIPKVIYIKILMCFFNKKNCIETKTGEMLGFWKNNLGNLPYSVHTQRTKHYTASNRMVILSMARTTQQCVKTENATTFFHKQCLLTTRASFICCIIASRSTEKWHTFMIYVARFLQFPSFITQK